MSPCPPCPSRSQYGSCRSAVERQAAARGTIFVIDKKFLFSEILLGKTDKILWRIFCSANTQHISSLTSIISLYAHFLPEDEGGHISRSGPPRSQPLGRPGSPHTYQEKRGQASSKKRGHLIQYV